MSVASVATVADSYTNKSQTITKKKTASLRERRNLQKLSLGRICKFDKNDGHKKDDGSNHIWHFSCNICHVAGISKNDYDDHTSMYTKEYREHMASKGRLLNDDVETKCDCCTCEDEYHDEENDFCPIHYNPYDYCNCMTPDHWHSYFEDYDFEYYKNWDIYVCVMRLPLMNDLADYVDSFSPVIKFIPSHRSPHRSPHL